MKKFALGLALVALLSVSALAEDTGTRVTVTPDGLRSHAWTRLPRGKASATSDDGRIKYGRAAVVGSGHRRLEVSSEFTIVLRDGTRLSDRFTYRRKLPAWPRD